MTDPSASSDDLMLFRFQIFYEDTVRSLLGQSVQAEHFGTSLDIFEVGELREATAVAALAVAGGVLPRQPFNTMLESPNVKRMLSGNLDALVPLDTSPPYRLIIQPLPPITELPDQENVLQWSEIDLDRELIPLIPFLATKYSSLMRQVHRNAFQRRFNAELLFSTEDRWQTELRTLAFGARNWFPAWGNVENSIWLADGLDSYLDLAEDLAAAAPPDASGHVSYFNVGEAGTMGTHDVKNMIERRSLLPLMAWRFGGAAIADTVSRRVRSLEDVIAGLVAEVDVEQLRAGRYEPRE